MQCLLCSVVCNNEEAQTGLLLTNAEGDAHLKILMPARLVV